MDGGARHDHLDYHTAPELWQTPATREHDSYILISLGMKTEEVGVGGNG